MAINSGKINRITGISSMAMRHVLAELGSAYEQQSGQPVTVVAVGGVDAARRVDAGEAFDFVVLAAEAIEQLAAGGRVDPESRTDLARSAVAIAVAAGATRPDISTEAALRDALLRARSVGYSTGPSGAHLVRLFERWGIADTIAPRIVQAPPGFPVGTLLARGEVELGFQQLSEFLHLPGIDVIGLLPPQIQVATVFSAAVCTASNCSAAPARFPYRADTHYAPVGQEIGTPAQLAEVLDAYGTRYALLVGPNSGYGLDNACMLDAIARGAGRYKGIAVVACDATLDELQALKHAGVVGVAWNVTHYGVDFYRNAKPLLQKLVALDMFVDIQVERDQLVPMMPMLADSGVRVLVDHCGRPTVEAGLAQPGFRALLELGATGRAFVKLSGFVKFSRQSAPYDDARTFVTALVDVFTPDHCLWASDWPYLRAPVRVDYGVLLHLVLTLFPDASVRYKLLWETPRRLFLASHRHCDRAQRSRRLPQRPAQWSRHRRQQHRFGRAVALNPTGFFRRNSCSKGLWYGSEMCSVPCCRVRRCSLH